MPYTEIPRMPAIYISQRLYDDLDHFGSLIDTLIEVNPVSLNCRNGTLPGGSRVGVLVDHQQPIIVATVRSAEQSPDPWIWSMTLDKQQ